jgi:hypothetical protein
LLPQSRPTMKKTGRLARQMTNIPSLSAPR